MKPVLKPILKIYITTVCNLNCYGCSSLCGSVDSYFLNPEDLKIQLSILQSLNFFNKIGSIQLFGGETLLHPNLVEICKIINSFTTLPIEIATNGLLINQYEINQLKELNKYNSTLLISCYLGYYNKYIQNIRYLNINKIPFKKQGGRFFFYKKDFYKRKENLPENFQCDTIKAANEYLLKNNRLYKCYHTVNLKQIYPELNENDYSINLLTVNNNTDIDAFFQQIKEPCKYCNDDQALIPWNLQSNFQHNQLDRLENLYLYNYNEYYKIYNSNHELIKTHLKYPIFHMPCGVENCDSCLHKCSGEYSTNIFMTRYINGIMDIFIPYKEYNFEELITFLKNQTILLKCNIYLVLIDNNLEILNQQKIYKDFLQFKNLYFLKANNLEEGQKIFLNNSFSKYIYYVKDINILLEQIDNKNYLENIFQNKEQLIQRN